MKLFLTFVLLAIFSSFVCDQGRAAANESTISGPLMTFHVNPDQSKFMVHAHRGGLLWFKGHDHFVKVGNYSAEVQLNPTEPNAASLSMTIQGDSLEETGAVFTAQQKQTIKKELNDIVLEKDKYPQITFQSTSVSAKVEGQQIRARITGNITLHGITRQIVIPATVTIEGSNMRATGHFSIDRKKFGVRATTAGHGTVRVKYKLDFDFDMLATPS